MIDKKIIRKEFENLPKGWIVLLETDPGKSLDVNIAVNEFLTNNGYKGVILSSSRPFSNLLNIYEKNNVDTKNLVIIDCVSKSQGGKADDNSNTLFVDNVSSLTQISLYITESIKNTKCKKYIYLDSIATMLIHNQAKAFTIFIHSIMTKLRINDAGGIFFSISNGVDEEIRNEIAQLCDKVIEI